MGPGRSARTEPTAQLVRRAAHHGPPPSRPGRRDEAALAVGHGLGERAFSDTGHGGEVVLGHADRVLDDAGVGREGELELHVLDVRSQAVGVVPVGPVRADVLRVAFANSVPLLAGEDDEVQLVEGLQIAPLLAGQMLGEAE